METKRQRDKVVPGMALALPGPREEVRVPSGLEPGGAFLDPACLRRWEIRVLWDSQSTHNRHHRFLGTHWGWTLALSLVGLPKGRSYLTSTCGHLGARRYPSV